MSKQTVAMTIAELASSIAHGYDGQPRDSDSNLIEDYTIVSDEPDGTFIPGAENWAQLQKPEVIMPTHSASGGFICRTVFGS